MNEVPDEIVVGIHHSGVELEEGLNTGKSNFCGKCSKNIHCHVKVEGKEAEIIMTCSDKACECKCRTHFACKRCGYLHPYGKKCDRDELVIKPNKKNDKLFDEIMEKDWSNAK